MSLAAGSVRFQGEQEQAPGEIEDQQIAEVSREPTEAGKKLKHLIEHPNFRRFIFFTVFIAMLLLAADSPYADYSHAPWARDTIRAFDIVTTVIFTIEAILLILGKGVKPYFTSIRNVFQFLIVGACWADVIIKYANIETSRAVTIIGVLRALRPLMAVSTQKEMGNILACLLKATLALTSIGALIIFLFVIGGLVGMQLFPYTLRNRCMWNGTDTVTFTLDDDPNVSIADFGYSMVNASESMLVQGALYNGAGDPAYYQNCGGGQTCGELYDKVVIRNGVNYTMPLICNDTLDYALDYYGRPNLDIINFDHFGWACITLFQVIMAVGWTDTQYKYQDAWHWMANLYFTCIIIIGVWVILNLAIAVLADAYNDSQEEAEETKRQERTLKRRNSRAGIKAPQKRGLVRLLQVWKEKAMSPAALASRAPWVKVVESRAFRWFYLLLIITSTCLLIGYDPYRTGDALYAYEATGWVFAGFFLVEMLIKMVAYSIYGYWSRPQNAFDGSLVLISLVEVIMAVGGVEALVLASARSLRILRIFRIAANVAFFADVLEATVRSLRAVTAIFVVLIVYLYICAILAMQTFGGEYGHGIMAHGIPYHFDYFNVAFFTIFQVVTTENWTGVMWTAYEGTSAGVFAVIFFIVVVAVGNIIILNMFLAILLDQMAEELENKRLEEEHKRKVEEFEEQRAARKMQQMLRAKNFIQKLRRASHEELKALTMIGVEGEPKFPQLSPWEITTYHMMWAKATAETDGKLPFPDVARFLRLIGQRLKHAPEHVTMEMKSMMADIKKEDTDNDDLIELDSVLKVLNRKRELDIEHQRKKSKKGMELPAAGDKAKSRLPTPSILFDKNLVYQKQMKKTVCGMGARHPFRRACLMMYYSPFRRVLTMLFIAVSGALSGLRFAMQRPNGYRADLEEMMGTPNFNALIYSIDGIFEFLLILEIILRMVVYGLWHDVDHSYFRNTHGLSWRIIDILIALSTLIALILDLSGATPDDRSQSARPYKGVQSLKLLCLIPRFHRTKVMVSSIVIALPKVWKFLLATLLVLISFAICGMFLFGGAFGSCSIADEAKAPADVADHLGRILPAQIENRTVCEATPGMEWGVPKPNFDTFKNACLALFQVMFIDGWSGILLSSTNARGFELQPSPESQVVVPYLFFFVWIFFGALFFLNLIIGSVVSTFDDLLKDDEGIKPLTGEQRQWVYTQRVLQTTTMVRLLVAPRRGCCVWIRSVCFRLVTSRDQVKNPRERDSYYGGVFNGFIMAIIVFNVVAMLAYQQGVAETLYSYLNMFFTAIYTIEFCVKIFGLGRAQYMRDGWNLFDAVLILLQGASFTAWAITYFLGIYFPQISLSSLKAFRALRLGRYSRSVRMLTLTLKFGAPALLNITLVLFIMLYIFAMLGMTLFGGILWSDGASISKHANFDTVWMSLQTVFRLATGDSWSGFYLDAEAAAEEGRYRDYVVPVDSRYVHAYIVIFMFVSLILVSVFIAVILEYYAIQSALVISEVEVNIFAQKWAKYDPSNTAYLPVWRLGELMVELGPPLSPVDRTEYYKTAAKRKAPPSEKEEAEQKAKERDQMEKFLQRLVIPVRNGGKVHFLEVVAALGEKKEGVSLGNLEAAKVRTALLANWPRSHPDLLSLPPQETISVTFNDDILDVMDGADWTEMQDAYLAAKDAETEEEPAELPEDLKTEKSKGMLSLPAHTLASMPSLKKLSMYINQDDITDEDVQTEMSNLKGADSLKGTIPGLEPLPELPVATSVPTTSFPDFAHIAAGLTAGFDAKVAPSQLAPPVATRPGSILKTSKYAAPPMAQPLIDSWIRIRTDLFSEDSECQLTALVLIRKLLSSPGKAKHMQVFRGVLAKECVSRFVFFLQEGDSPMLQYEAAWALTHMCSDVQCVLAVVENGALPVIVQLAKNHHDNVAVQAMHAIGSLCKDQELRETLMWQGALQAVLEQLNPQATLPVLRMATWSLAALCGTGQGGPGRAWEMIAPAALTILPHLLGADDEELLTQACRALAALGEARGPSSPVSFDHLQDVIDTGCLPRIVQLMGRPGVELHRAAMRVAANVVTGDDAQA
jgi:hypothetical protein